MRYLEKIIVLVLVLFVLLRFFIASKFISTSIVFFTLLLSIIYLFFGFALQNQIRLRDIFKTISYSNISALKILGTFFSGLVLALVCIYSLFKFMSWPFADQGLTIALQSLLAVVLVVLIKLYFNKRSFSKTFLIRLFVIGIIGFIFYVLPANIFLELLPRIDFAA